uniref:hypothetical protein n=1 Tax=Candidatus Ichthyocystis hellenicum TaxID=1561003 RepID=UPI0011120A65
MNIIQGYYRCVDDISLNEGEESISDVGVGYEDGDSLDNFSDECEWQSILSFSPSESLFTAGDDVEVYNCDRLEEEWELLSLNDESETVTSSAERWLTGKYDSIVSVDEWERVSASDESLSARGKEVSEADSNVDRCVSILEAVVNGVSRKFTNRSICECRYKKELLSLPDVKE